MHLARALESSSYTLRNIRLPQGTVASESLHQAADGLVAADLVVTNGRVAWLGPIAERDDLPPGPDLGRDIVWPLPVDCHTHLDKGLVVARSPNPDGTFDGASRSTVRDQQMHQCGEDMRRRADFALRSAFGHGTAAIRSHVDANPDTFDRNFAIMCELAEDWRDKVKLQLCPFTGISRGREWIRTIAAAAAAQPCSGILSIYLPLAGEIDDELDEVFKAAERHGLELDFHVDENLDPASRALDAVARAVVRHGFKRPVLAGHCCALSVQPDDVVDRTLDRVAEARIGIVALPLCNSYLMDRQAERTPRYRGMAPVHEMIQRGIPVALASDNVRDGYHAYGDFNLPHLFRDAVRLMHLDHPVGDWAGSITATPAELMGLQDCGRISPGSRADFMVFEARTWPEFISRPDPPRVIVRNGQPSGAKLPDFAELDDLQGMKV